MSSKNKKEILPETDSGPYHTSKMEFVVKRFNRFRW